LAGAEPFETLHANLLNGLRTSTEYDQSRKSVEKSSTILQPLGFGNYPMLALCLLFRIFRAKQQESPEKQQRKHLLGPGKPLKLVRHWRFFCFVGFQDVS
jgi:hypothetical protein